LTTALAIATAFVPGFLATAMVTAGCVPLMDRPFLSALLPPPIADGPVRGATLVISAELSGSARRARFRGAGGIDEKIALVPSAGEVAAVLPEFLGYGVLSLVP